MTNLRVLRRRGVWVEVSTLASGCFQKCWISDLESSLCFDTLRNSRRELKHKQKPESDNSAQRIGTWNAWDYKCSRCISSKCFIAKDWRGYILYRSLDVAWHCKTDIVFLHLGSLNTLGLNWFWPGRSCVSRAMAKRSWLFGVTSWDDTVKFAQLLFGVDVAFENYAERLPHRSNKSFLLFAKGACAEGRPFFEIGDFIAPQLEEIQRWEQNVRNNNARPTKSQQMLNADGWTVYYWSAQVTRAPCLCRTSFGADQILPLFCLQAADQRHSRKNKAIDKQLTHQLLTVPNPHRTGKLQGMLLVHENMVVRLADVLAPHLGLVKDKLAVVVKVDLHHEDQKRLDRREPGFCLFFPDYMAKGIWVKLLKGKNSPMEEALLQTWEEKFQNVADHTTDAKTLFFVELVHAEFKIDLKLGEETEKIEVIRWQFPLLHGMLRTAYSAQGLTLDGGVLLRRGPPTYLRELTSWKPKLLRRWSGCSPGLSMMHCKHPDTVLCQWDLIGFDWRGPGEA